MNQNGCAADDRVGGILDDTTMVPCSTCPKRREAVPSSNASSVNRNVKDTGFETITFTGLLLDSVNRALRQWELNMG
jgi:hypothetical protein